MTKTIADDVVDGTGRKGEPGYVGRPPNKFIVRFPIVLRVLFAEDLIALSSTHDSEPAKGTHHVETRVEHPHLQGLEKAGVE
jgi:hypothetical protein